MTIWVDENGDPSDAPMASEGAAVDAIVLALLLWSGVAGAAPPGDAVDAQADPPEPMGP